MAPLDYFVLFIYLLGILAVGLFFANKNKNADDMFAAGGESPWWVSGLSAFMTMFSAGTFVVWGGIAFKSGLVAVAINLCYGVSAMLVGFFVAGHWKRMGVKTPAEFITIRFGEGALKFYTFSMMVFRIVGTAVALYSLAVVIVALMPLEEGNFFRDPQTGTLAIHWAVLLFGVIVVAYTMLGGLWAVLMTDVLQFIVLNLAVIFMVPLILLKAGGWDAFTLAAPEGFFLPTSAQYSWYFLMGWCAIHFFMIGAEWAFAQRFISVPTERDAKKATYLFGALYLLSPFLWLLPPLVFRVIDPSASPEQAYVLATKTILPVGMVGLMIAAMFSATASMVSSQLNVFAGVLTEDVYKKLFKPNEEVNLVKVGRIFTILLGAILIAVALAIPYLGGAEKVVVGITSLLVGPLLAPTIWGLFSKRIGESAIWYTAGISFTLGLFFKFGLTAGGFLTEISLFSGLADWVQSIKSLDMILGVVVPVTILTFLHYTGSEENIGAIRVAKIVTENVNSPVRTASHLPALIVAIALFACGLLMLVLALFNATDRLILGSFGGTLFILGSIVYKLTPKPPTPEVI